MLIQLSNSLISGLFVTITNIFWTVTSLTVINAPLFYSNNTCPRNNSFALKRTSRFLNLNWWWCYRRCSWCCFCYWCGRFCCGTNRRSHVFIATCTENIKKKLFLYLIAAIVSELCILQNQKLPFFLCFFKFI